MKPRPSIRLFAALYPFGAGAAGVNLFFASLLGGWIGLPHLTPWQAAAWGLFLGLPATWVFGCHIVRLMQRADGT
ncbi:NnrT protein [Oceaniglobus trochenteri]|uniref:NnrT protein n=1 Tax=Oceaniglobus trochenteri TaxID=2763260 RepID=UPI001CFFABA7|nr:NnrT protein [Oceaniglobus trochenteri]